jgi:hypothetical protein
MKTLIQVVSRHSTLLTALQCSKCSWTIQVYVLLQKINNLFSSLQRMEVPGEAQLISPVRFRKEKIGDRRLRATNGTIKRLNPLASYGDDILVECLRLFGTMWKCSNPELAGARLNPIA